MASTSNYLKNLYLKISNLLKDNQIFVYLLALLLISIPIKNNFISISIILFVLYSLSFLKKKAFVYNQVIVLPIVLFGIMTLSVLWTRDLKLTISGLQKELPLLLLPLIFLFIPKLTKQDVLKAFKIYSYAMVIFAFVFLTRAVIRYIITSQIDVFFYHNLVTFDLNAIYISIFASFAIFYFISQKLKTFEKGFLFLLIAFVFLLSSKSIITIDVVLITIYYIFFSETKQSVRNTTLISVFAFLILSLVFVKKVRERFLLEYETAFVDNTLNYNIGTSTDKVYNVSLKQAWNIDKFQPNHFFPGTALRVYQMRTFIELVKEENVFFTGFGLEASQQKIRDKAIEHNLYTGYGEFNYHNQYLQTFSDIGFFGFVILVIMLILNLKNAILSKDFLHIVFAITMIMLFLTESFFCRQKGVVFFIVLYCIFNTINYNEKAYLKN